VETAEALAVLGVREGTDLAGVRAAFRGLLRGMHPDVAPNDAGAHERTARLTEAYEVVVALVELHGTVPATTPPVAPPPEPPPPAPPPGPAVRVEARPDEAIIAVGLPPAQTYAALYEAAGHVGEISYFDRRLGILEVIVRFEGGPSCSVVLTLAERHTPHARSEGPPRSTDHTEVLCTMESIEAAPTPPIAPVVDALEAALGRLPGGR
jgi:hypothetical protein